jgi:uncharacterized iron-regulated membrane protein
MTFRQILFWTHLAAGLIAGASIGIMCFTGAAIGFESQLVAWAERDARQIAPPAANATRLPLQELLKRARDAKPGARPSGIAVFADPTAAVAIQFGRDGALYANPFTGDVRAPASARMHDFMHLMEDWHRVLALSSDNRPIGKAINGAGNVAFFLLAATGLYLWLPRTWSWRGVKAVALFNWRLTGKARDFNWHNTVGLWCAPVLIVLTLTAVPMSYRWAGDLIYRSLGEIPPGQPSPGAPAAANEIQPPTPDSRPLNPDALLAIAQREFPQWQQITLRLSANLRGGDAPRSAQAKNSAMTPTELRPRNSEPGTRNSEPGTRNSEPRTRNSDARPSTPQPVGLTVKEPGTWPRTATTTLTLNPFTGEVLKNEPFAALSTGRQIRSWMRFLHTGEALGFGGQLIATLACLGGCVLVYTGIALAWRRFFGKRPAPDA